MVLVCLYARSDIGAGQGAPEGGDGAPAVPEQAPAAEAAIQRRQVVPHRVVAVLYVHHNHLHGSILDQH